jgi:hypothetical protein
MSFASMPSTKDRNHKKEMIHTFMGRKHVLINGITRGILDGCRGERLEGSHGMTVGWVLQRGC